jgi:hypothetical protein
VTRLISQLARALAAQRRNDVLKECARCGASFVGYANRRYCTSRCQSAATSAQYRKEHKTS